MVASSNFYQTFVVKKIDSVVCVQLINRRIFHSSTKMAEGTYEYEVMRAELLGIDKPNQEEFEKARAERLKHEQEEADAAEAAGLEEQEEGLRSVGGKLDELNHILSSTQQKLNRFKQTACGSFSHMFSRGSVDVVDGPSTSADAPNAEDDGDAQDNDINTALENLDEMQQKEAGDVQPVIPTERILNAKKDIQKKMSSHLDKLDSLLNKADNADVAMSEQTKQMKKMAK